MNINPDMLDEIAVVDAVFLFLSQSGYRRVTRKARFDRLDGWHASFDNQRRWPKWETQ